MKKNIIKEKKKEVKVYRRAIGVRL